MIVHNLDSLEILVVQGGCKIAGQCTRNLDKWFPLRGERMVIL